MFFLFAVKRSIQPDFEGSKIKRQEIPFVKRFQTKSPGSVMERSTGKSTRSFEKTVF